MNFRFGLVNERLIKVDTAPEAAHAPQMSKLRKKSSRKKKKEQQERSSSDSSKDKESDADTSLSDEEKQNTPARHKTGPLRLCEKDPKCAGLKKIKPTNSL